jgi:hypothetical protein
MERYASASARVDQLARNKRASDEIASVMRQRSNVRDAVEHACSTMATDGDAAAHRYLKVLSSFIGIVSVLAARHGTPEQDILRAVDDLCGVVANVEFHRSDPVVHPVSNASPESAQRLALAALFIYGSVPFVVVNECGHGGQPEVHKPALIRHKASRQY